jgi:TetR/AcrR family transcriptional repressor of nem operon
LPRSISFDEHETLRAIGQLFWRNGYTATAMDQICEHVSLTKPSIYNTYGDKATLFRKVVDWYADEMGEQGVAVLKGKAPVSEEVAGLLRHFLVRPASDIVSQGCLLTSSMMELQFSEPELFDYVVKRIDRVRDAIETYLSTARKDGLLKSDCDPSALSEYVFTVFQGLRMQSRTSAGRINLERTISTAMGPLRDAEPMINHGH